MLNAKKANAKKMINTYIKNVTNSAGKSAKETAQKIAKQMAREPVEMIKSGGTQLTGSEPGVLKDQPSVMQQVMTANGSVQQPTASEEAAIHSQAKRRMQELEEEIKMMSQKRLQKEEEWQKSQQQLLGQVEQGKKPKVEQLVQPTSIRKRGMTAGTKQKQGTKEMSKQMSG